MRVLLDESVPRGLRALLRDHEVSTVQEMGWAGLDNGELLRTASAFQVFVTADRGIEHEQDLARFSVGIVLLIAKSNRLEDYMPLADGLAKAVTSAQPGKLTKVAA